MSAQDQPGAPVARVSGTGPGGASLAGLVTHPRLPVYPRAVERALHETSPRSPIDMEVDGYGR